MRLVACSTNLSVKDSTFNPIDSLIFLTNRVGRLLSNAIKHRADMDDIEGLFPHMGILVDLWLRDGVRQQELAVSVIKDKGTITRSLDLLEKKGIVVRVPDDQDKRRKRIFLTPKGRAMQLALMPYAQEVLRDATAEIPDDKLQICKQVLAQMYWKLNSE